ncbi:tyrosine-type recombinase/integrase [Enterobacter sp. RHBSTW-00994]|uniref:tyrosine-type recombinase/integrase n=1 Tax=Enterobacter sp. RHBSTW-00994 TaxID=2742676 RepID=UPI0015E9A7E2|nr:tyrosine-type recombinase/integrase [Enterobacter sp. RHBSTW-00994]QLR43720.1 tyrosine-type recombinase/integrase [Enterobacter sp. RHBSTW-00994]
MAGKRKNPADAVLPPRVYRGKSKYEFHPASGGSVSLCPLGSPVSLVWAKYEAALKDIEEKTNLSGLIDEFFASADYHKLGNETRKDYKKYSRKLIPVFGKMDPDSVKPQHIRQYMDKRGVAAPVQANREKAFLSRVYGWAYERGMVKGNPCKGVRQFKEEERERYVTDEEYNALYGVSPIVVQVAMEIAYLCLARQGDVLAVQKAQLLPEGIFIRQGKTAAKQIKAWSDRLAAAIELSKSLPLKDGLSSVYVIHQQNGRRYTRDGFNSRWQQAKDEAQKKNPHLLFDFTFHDLKAKGVSDLEGSLQEKQQISGHKTITQTARYDRKVKIVPVVGGQ